MKRTALDKLIKWKDSSNRKPLIVWGARQVGKTYLIRDIFAEQFYKDNYIYIDCNVEDEIVRLCDGTANADKILEIISLYKNKQITKDTLLIFDEVQEYPNIVSSLKYFCQDHRDIPVIATGSMVRIKLLRESRKRGNGKKESFLFPVGKINQLNIYPMTFDEYLMNVNSIMYQRVKNSYESRKPLDSEIHELVLSEFYKYLLVGGLPEPVSVYISSNSLLEARQVLEDNYDNYLADMELYQASKESIVRSRSVFSNIFAELNKDSKNFSSGVVEKGTKIRDYRSPIEWLELAHLVYLSKQVKEHISTPLTEEDQSHFRLYLTDTGIFTYQSRTNAATFVSKEASNKLSGIFFENYVACELSTRKLPLFYWKGKSRYELEFIVESNGELYPIDAKKGSSPLKSLKEFSNHNSYTAAIKVSQNNYGYDEQQRLLTIPYYYMPFLADDLANGIFKI